MTKTDDQPDTREVRLVVPDARSPEVRRRVAASVASLSREDELIALRWIESVSEFDTTRSSGEPD